MLMASASCQYCSVMSSVFLCVEMPALFTSTSRRPKLSIAVLMMAAALSESATLS